MADLFIRRAAAVSPCGKYRTTLSREWGGCGPGNPWLGWIMLNPSTADAQQDDPTIRRCIGFSRDLSFAGMSVFNLFNFRAASPRNLKAAKDPHGIIRGEIMESLIEAHELGAIPMIIAAWGRNGGQLGRDREVYELMRRKGVQLHCLRLTSRGHPEHPLYLPASCRPIQFEMAKVS